MSRQQGIVRRLLIWNYERGTLAYDIVCGLILAFIFFVPRSCFSPSKPEVKQEAATGVSGSSQADAAYPAPAPTAR